MYNSNPYAKYHANAKNAMTPRTIESTALFKAASLLIRAQENMDDEALLTEALNYNKVLWTILVTDVSDQMNPLPTEIKMNILTLANFIFKRIVDLQYKPTADQLNALIAINKNIALGLS